jgi:hypothetical protein
MSTELTVIQRAVKALGYDAEREKALVELAGKSADIKTITNKPGYEQVHGARMVLKNTRVEIQRLGKDARDDATKFSKAVIAEEKRLISLIEPEETRLERLQDKWDADREAERVAALHAEEQRVEALEERVAELRGNRMLSPTSGSKVIVGHIEDVERIVVDESFQEYRNQAEAAKAEGLTWLRELLTAARAHEAEQARINAEREELARLRKAEEERQAAERARIAEEERLARAAREAEARKQAEEIRKQREEQEATARAERERIAAEERRLATERAEFQRQQEEARQQREAEERERAEHARIAAIKRPDDAELVSVLSRDYRVPDKKVIEWLAATSWKKAKAEAA